MQNRVTGNKNTGWLPPFLWKYKWALLIAAMLGGIVAYSATLFVPNKYEATAVVYAAGGGSDNQMVMKQGNTLILLQFLKSSFLRDRAIEAYNLVNHYDIDTGNAQGKATLIQRYTSNVNFERTLYKSVRIKVTDKDPEFAARLANGIVRLSNDVKKHIISTNKKENLQAIAQNYHDKQQEVDSLAEDLRAFNQQATTQALAKLNGRLKEVKDDIHHLRTNLRNIREKLRIHDLNHHLDQAKERYNQAKSKYQLEEGKLAAYRKELPAGDSAVIHVEASVQGLKSQLQELEERLKTYSKHEDRYNKLIQDLALKLELRNNLEKRIATLSNSFEPTVESIEILTKKKKLNAEMERLKQLKKKYEQAIALFEKPQRAAYMVSRAVSNPEPVSPKTLLITLAGAVLMFLLTLGVLLVRKHKLPASS